ncbi:unnamed protein product [Leptidea sinapis]|nr:unnamed protein product [Leptidea sinapis]
MFIFKSV